MVKPRAFVSSSSESLEIAAAIRANIEKQVDVTLWNDSFFEPSSSVLDDLLSKIALFDFGIFLFTADDGMRIREKALRSVRDNVLFELGLFVGKLGRERAFIVTCDGQEEIRVPTDLLGVNAVKFVHHDDHVHWAVTLQPACNVILETIRKRGLSPERLRARELERRQAASLAIRKVAPIDKILRDTTFGVARLLVIEDNIREAMTDVVVSSDDTRFNAGGGVSKTIRKKCGSAVRAQLDYFVRQKFRQCQVAITTGGDWDDKRAVIHPAVFDLEYLRPPTVETVRVVTRRSLECAAAMGAKSVALPVFGVGHAGVTLNTADSICTIVAESIRFLQANQSSGLEQVAIYVLKRSDADSLPEDLRTLAGMAC
jgi:O-acetyl-ADP-ribose deacetylase (regulator of RNase III)